MLALWVKIKDTTDKGHIVVGVYNMSPNQGSLLTKLLASATGSVVLTSSHPDGGFQPSGCLLGKQYNCLETIQENPRVYRGKLPGPDVRQTNQRRSITAPGYHKCR